MEVLRFGSAIVGGLTRGVFTFFLTLMLAAYIMITRERLLDFFAVLVKPTSRPSFELLLARLDRGLSGVVRGQLLICLVNGVLTAIGFWLIGLKYWPILSLVAGVMSIIPIFGSILSSIPAVAIGLTQGVGTGLLALVYIVGIHQVEANILNPKIYGIAAKIHPVLVIFALLVGEHFFGLVGALLAVPCMSIAQNVFLHFRAISLGADAPTDTFLPRS
jgi:predicted PurR-regulated permease PerM